jgi:hypothetical protein
MRARPLLLALTGLTVALAAWNWVLAPDHAFRWVRAMLVLPAMWGGLILFEQWTLRGQRRRGIDDDVAVRRYGDAALTLVCLGVGILPAALLGLRLLVAYGFAPDVGRRVAALTTGAILIALGNALPKILTPLSMLPPGGAARQQAARRFVGRVFVLLGGTLAAASLLAPPELATFARDWIGVSVVVTVLLAIAWMNTGLPGREESA